MGSSSNSSSNSASLSFEIERAKIGIRIYSDGEEEPQIKSDGQMKKRSRKEEIFTVSTLFQIDQYVLEHLEHTR